MVWRNCAAQPSMRQRARLEGNPPVEGDLVAKPAELRKLTKSRECRAIKPKRTFDFALAAIIWHEMAHIDGADEAAAQRAEEQLWREFILGGPVDRTRGMQYLALLQKRR
jgi:hypothetical protein